MTTAWLSESTSRHRPPEGRWATLSSQALLAALLGCALALVAGCKPSDGSGPGSSARSAGTPTTSPAIPSVEPPKVEVANLDRSLAELVQSRLASVLTNRTSAEAWGRYGQVLHTVEFLAEARTCYEQAVALDPASARWPHLLGLIRIQDDPDVGFALLQRAAQLAGTTTDAPRVRLLQALMERGRADEAGALMDQLLQLDFQHPVARLEKARLLLGRQQLAEAEAALEPCLTNSFTRRAGLLLLGQVRQRQGDEAGAGRLTAEATAMPRPFDWPDPFWREVTALRVDRGQAAEQINGLLMQGNLAEAAPRLQRLLAAAPDDPEAWLLLGRLRLLEKRCRDAEDALGRHLTLQTNSLNGWMQLSLALLCQERWNDGAATLRRVIVLKPEFAPAHANLGYALARLGDAAGAIRSYREVLRLNPGNAEAHFSLAEELGLSGQPAEALVHLQNAARLAPSDPRIPVLRQRLETQARPASPPTR